MARITFVQPDGSREDVTVREGLSVMEGAIQAGIPGILAECGGACSCATCRVDIDAGWEAAVDAPSEIESDMLSLVPDQRPSSRLSCQIPVTDKLDGLVVYVPKSQIS